MTSNGIVFLVGYMYYVQVVLQEGRKYSRSSSVMGGEAEGIGYVALASEWCSLAGRG